MVRYKSSQGSPLDRIVRDRLGLSWNAARAAIRSGKIFVGDPPTRLTDPTIVVRTSEAIAMEKNAPRPHVAERASIERAAILHCDAAVVVVDKPAGISTVPFGDETPDRTTLDALVREILAKKAQARGESRGRAPLGVVHRLDKDTSGVMVFTRTLEAKRHLAAQFREHSVERRYTAIVHGIISSARTFRSYLVENRGDGLRGSAKPGHREGQLAITHVKPLRALSGATLISCELETGRTHQIRIHLSEAGCPLVGEKVYVRRFEGLRIEAPRMMLHAAELGFEHPVTFEDVHFTAPPPEDFLAVLRRLEPSG